MECPPPPSSVSSRDGCLRLVLTSLYNIDDTIVSKAMSFDVHPQSGNFSGSPPVRWTELEIHNVFAPIAATSADGTNITDAISWDAATLTATVELGAVTASAGASLQIQWAESVFSEQLCRQDHIGWPRLHKRAMAVKRAIDWEASRGTQPSKLLNLVANTAVRMQALPQNAPSELAAYDDKLAAAVALHTKGGAAPYPSQGLQTRLRSWLSPSATPPSPPPPSPSPSPPPTPGPPTPPSPTAQCMDVNFGSCDGDSRLVGSVNTQTWAECCSQCAAASGCAKFAWHAVAGDRGDKTRKSCNFHRASAVCTNSNAKKDHVHGRVNQTSTKRLI